VKLVFTKLSRSDLSRLREFIGAHNPAAARRAAGRIKATAKKLLDQPLLGKRVTDPGGLIHEDIREVVIPFVARGYLLRYQVLPSQIRVLRIWHTREQRE